MKTLWKIFDATLNWILAICVLAITLICLAQIFARFIVNSSLPWSDEACRYLFVITVSLGAGVCVRDRNLIAVDLIPQKLKGKIRFYYVLVLNILVMCMAYVLLVYGYRFAQMNMKQLSSSMQIPMGIVYLVLSLSGLLIIISTLRNIVYDYMERDEKGKTI
ncbi:MAG: TRAP transporter small permease [Spirochaetia bacterium]|nr:TRAP transporter small permease [Spirochaetia bacterium]